MSDQDRSRNHRDRKPKLDAPERPSWQQRVDRPASADKPKSPLIPHEIQPEDLDMGVRVQLKTLSAENAEMTEFDCFTLRANSQINVGNWNIDFRYSAGVNIRCNC